MLYNDIKHIIKHFDFKGTYESAEELVNGNVNFTYKLYYRQADGSVVHYVLQRINTNCVPRPRKPYGKHSKRR